jgi:hypothetical protein
MGGVWTKRLLTVMVAVALAAALAAQAGAQTEPGYGSPLWAPDWFKYCTNPKQWVEWTWPGQIMVWGFNYTPPPDMPTLSLGSGVLSVKMDNLRQPDYYKQVWVDITYTWSGTKIPDFSSPSNPLLEWDSGWSKLLKQNSPVGPGLGMGWYNEDLGGLKGRFTAYFEIWPQPDWEKFTLHWDPQTYTINGFDRVVMLTQCNPIPEPVFFQMGALLGLSGLGMLKLRRR